MRARASSGRRRLRARNVMLVLLVLVAGGLLTSRLVRDSSAEAALNDALVTSRIPGRTEETRRRFERLIEDYGGSRAAWAAHGHLAALEAANHRVAEARALWERLAEDGPTVLAADAEMSLIHLDREEGRLDDLADRLEDLIEGGDSSLPEDVLLFELAETLEQLGRYDEARRIKRFEEVVPDRPRVQR